MVLTPPSILMTINPLPHLPMEMGVGPVLPIPVGTRAGTPTMKEAC